MTQAQSEIISAALALPPEIRVELAEELLSSLDGPEQSLIEADWAEEIERRIDQLDGGDANMLPGDQVVAKLRTQLP
jgi:putative addiction module component (TIGR02574 family)